MNKIKNHIFYVYDIIGRLDFPQIVSICNTSFCDCWYWFLERKNNNLLYRVLQNLFSIDLSLYISLVKQFLLFFFNIVNGDVD